MTIAISPPAYHTVWCVITLLVACRRLPQTNCCILRLYEQTVTRSPLPLRALSPPTRPATLPVRAQVHVVGECPGDYPLQKKRHTLEFLRGIAHLRPRTNTIAAVARVRSALAQVRDGLSLARFSG